MTQPDLMQLLQTIKAGYSTRFEITEYTLDFWFALLEDLSADIALHALKYHASVSPFPPTPHDIRKYAAELTMSADLKLSGQAAWNLVKGQIWKAEADACTTFPPRVLETVQHIGWDVLQQSAPNDPFMRKEFLDVYAEFKRQDDQRVLLPASVRAILAKHPHSALLQGEAR